MARNLYLYLARFISLVWHFSLWIEFLILLLLLRGLGWISVKLSEFLGSRFGQYATIWAKLFEDSNKLMNISEKLAILIIAIYVICFILAELAGVRVIRSNRVSHQLRQMLLTTIDEIPDSSSDKRVSAKSIANKRANDAVKRSFVLVARHKRATAFVRIPAQIQVRKNIENSLADVADDLSSLLNLKSSEWDNYRGSASFNRYKIMQFK